MNLWYYGNQHFIWKLHEITNSRHSFITNVELDRMDLNLQRIPLTGNFKHLMQIFQHLITGLDGPGNEFFLFICKIIHLTR